MAFTAISHSKSIFFYTLYALSSVCMTIFNKKVMQEYEYPRMLLIAQNIASVLFLYGGSKIVVPYFFANEEGKAKDAPLDSGASATPFAEILSEYFHMRPFALNHLYYCLPITFTFLFMLLSSLRALTLVSVATVVVFRNVATLFVAVGDYFLFQKKFVRTQIIALVIIAVGALIYAYNDMEATMEGYVWVTLNTFAVILNSLIEKYVTVNINQTAVGISCYQNTLGTIVLLLFVTLTDGWGTSIGDFAKISPSGQFMFLLTCVFGTTIGIAYFSLNKFESPTSITVAGNMNKFISVLVSYFVFNTIITLQSSIGLIVCIAGGMYYSIASIQAREQS